MEKIEATGLLIVFGAVMAFCVYQDRRPRRAGQTGLVPWTLLGLVATAAELITFYYALSVFMNS